jgi:pilus assembly protein CpaE
VLRAIVICPDQDLSERLETAVQATGEVSVQRILDRYPVAIDLVRALRAHAPEVVFLSFEDVDKAQEVAKFLETEADGIQIVAIHRHLDARLLRETMRAGVREFLADPFEEQAVLESIDAVKVQVQRKPPVLEATSQIFAFLPSKAGVGTSTIALNVSGSMSRRPGTRVVLSDFDLNSGMLRFMLKLQNEYSVIDAAENALRIDENLWPQLVTNFGQLDVLHAGRVNPNLRIEGAQIRGLIEFMRRNYQAVCFDLSGNLERYSLEIMQDCKRVLLVCTPEIPSLHLAREKLQFLRTVDLEARTVIVLNRMAKKPLFTQAQVAEIVGVPVVASVTNDYTAITEATASGTFVEEKSDLGKQFTQLSKNLVESRAPAKGGKRKFLEQFSVSSSSVLQR